MAVWIGTVASILAILAFVGAVIRLVWRFSRRVSNALERVESQVTPNGGNSDKLADQVIQLRRSMAGFHETLNTHMADDLRVWRRIDEVIPGALLLLPVKREDFNTEELGETGGLASG